MRLIAIITLVMLLGGCADNSEQSFCLKDSSDAVQSDFKFSSTEVIFLKGNIYIRDNNNKKYYTTYNISSNAQHETTRVTEIANSERLHPFKATGTVSGKMVTCGPSGRKGMELLTMSVSNPVEFTDQDFNNILNESR